MNRQIGAEDSGPPLTVVGVVADVKEYGPQMMTPPAIYVPFRQDPQNALSIVVRGARPAASLVPEIRAHVQRIAPEQPVFNIRPLAEVVEESHAMLTLSTLLLGLFGALALALSLLGIFGVMTYTANRQAREWGIRMALGASPRAVFALVIQRGMTLMVAGLAVGAAAAVPALSLLTAGMQQSMSVTLLPPGSALWITLVGTMLAVSFIATAAPARRAMRSDPLATLRAE